MTHRIIIMSVLAMLHIYNVRLRLALLCLICLSVLLRANADFDGRAIRAKCHLIKSHNVKTKVSPRTLPAQPIRTAKWHSFKANKVVVKKFNMRPHHIKMLDLFDSTVHC